MALLVGTQASWVHWGLLAVLDSPRPPQGSRLAQLHEAPASMASAGDPAAGSRDAADQNFDYMFKLLLIGNSSVGKTSFLFRYADDSFTPAFVSTVGIDFKVKTIYRNDKRIKLQIWVGGLPSPPPALQLAWSPSLVTHCHPGLDQVHTTGAQPWLSLSLSPFSALLGTRVRQVLFPKTVLPQRTEVGQCGMASP